MPSQLELLPNGLDIRTALVLTADLCIEIDQHTNQALASFPTNGGLVAELRDASDALLFLCLETSLSNSSHGSALNAIWTLESVVHIASLISHIRFQLFMVITDPADSREVLYRMRRVRLLLMQVMEQIVDVI
jgi:hypothetical protein